MSIVIVLLQLAILFVLRRILCELKTNNRIPMGKLNKAIDRVEDL